MSKVKQFISDEAGESLAFAFGYPMFSSPNTSTPTNGTKRTCTCGTNAVMGDVEAKYHSSWCDLYPKGNGGTNEAQ